MRAAVPSATRSSVAQPETATTTTSRPVRQADCAHAPQVLGEVGRGRIAVLQALRECLQAGLFQLRRNIANKLTRGLRLVVVHLPQQLPNVARPERHECPQSIW